MRAGVFLLVAVAALPGCAPTAEFEPNVPPAAAPQSLLPEAYSAPAATAVAATSPRPVVVSSAPSSSIYAVAPAPGRPGLGFPGTMLNPYHPQWTINVQ
jgi:hypothetical protein